MNPNTEFERFTQRVFQILKNNGILKPTFVKHDVKLAGKSGCEHQIDVYFEYELSGNNYRVAIECKNYSAFVPIGKVRDFYGVIQDIGNIQGIIVSAKGFQEGAKKFADYYGISLKTLRHPEINEIFGSITTVIHDNRRKRLFLIDNQWIKDHNLNLDKIRELHSQLQYDMADYWKDATHFPIEIISDIIKDSDGNRLSTFPELEKQLPKNPESGTSVVFSFEDGWIESRYWGAVKIREVKYEYINMVHEKTLNLAAKDFVEGILEDALRGKTDYVPKF